MKFDDCENEIKERLKEPEYAAEYLTNVLANESEETFLIALKDVIEAKGFQESQLPDNFFSNKDNLTLATLVSILKSMGFSLQIN